MSNDPLPVSDILVEPPNDADYDAIYAQIMATERGRGFLTKYASRNRHSDTQSLVGMIARLEAAIRDNPPPQVAAALLRSLGDLAAAIKQVEAILLASGSSASDDLFAAERIQDIAMAIRQRQVDATLCDALEAATREVGDAIVRNNAAAARILSAVALLRDLMGRVNDMIALIGAVTGSGVEPADRPAANETQADHDGERFDVTAPESATVLPSLPKREAKLPASAEPRPVPHAAPSNPLAAVLALSDEELIALFS